MQTNFISKLAQLSLVITALFITTSCISNTDNNFPSSLQIGIEVENMDSTLTYSDDNEIEVDRVGIVLGELFYSTSDDSLLLNEKPTPIPLDATSPNYQNPIGLGGRNVPEAGLYQSFKLTIPRAEENNNNTDFDFVENGTRYTMIFEGTYNDSAFTYKSERVIERTFPIGPIDVPAENAQIIYLISLDIQNLFIGGSGALDPREETNADQIDNNIEQTLDFVELETQ